MRAVELELVRDLSPDLRGRRLANPSITHDGAAIALAMPPGPPQTHTYAPGETAKLYPEHLGSFSGDVLVWSKETLSEVALTDVPARHPHLQTFQDGRLLLVGARGRDRTGFVYTTSGDLLRSMALGDAVEHLFVSAEGDIWAGYFDEGVFGNSVGSSGLVRFTGEGDKLWGFNENAGSGPFIDDCYALNVSRRAVWFCAYSDWAIVRVEGRTLHCWRNSASGVRAIAVDNGLVLIFGGYGDDRTTCRLGRLAANTVEDIEDLALHLPGDGPLSETAPRSGRAPAPPFWATGRDDALHLFKDDRWYRLTVRDAAIGR